MLSIRKVLEDNDIFLKFILVDDMKYLQEKLNLSKSELLELQARLYVKEKGFNLELLEPKYKVTIKNSDHLQKGMKEIELYYKEKHISYHIVVVDGLITYLGEAWEDKLLADLYANDVEII